MFDIPVGTKLSELSLSFGRPETVQDLSWKISSNDGVIGQWLPDAYLDKWAEYKENMLAYYAGQNINIVDSLFAIDKNLIFVTKDIVDMDIGVEDEEEK